MLKACKASRGNAQLLQESLLYAKAGEVKENSLIQVRAPHTISNVIIPNRTRSVGVPQEMSRRSGANSFQHSLGLTSRGAHTVQSE